MSYYCKMALNLHIREIRKSRGLTIAELAEIIGVSEPHLSQIERGTKNLNNHLILRLSDALDVNPEDLIASAQSKDINEFVKIVSGLSESDRDRVLAFATALDQTP